MSYLIKNASLSEEQEGLDTRLSQTTSSGSVRSKAYQNLWTCLAWTMVKALSPPTGTTGLSGMIRADYSTTKLNWFSQRRGKINQLRYRRRCTKVYLSVRGPHRDTAPKVFFVVVVVCDKPAGNESLRKASTSGCWRYTGNIICSSYISPFPCRS